MPELRAKMLAYQDRAIASPYLFETVVVPTICIA